MKSIEILTPDNLNYEMSKFLILQTGDIHLRSGESNRLNLYFRHNNQIDKQVRYQLKKKLKHMGAESKQDFQEASHLFKDKYLF